MKKNSLVHQIALQSGKNAYLISNNGYYEKVFSGGIFDPGYVFPKVGSPVRDKTLCEVLEHFKKSGLETNSYFYELTICGKNIPCKAVLTRLKHHFFSKSSIFLIESISSDAADPAHLNVPVLNVILKSKYLYFVLVDKNLKLFSFNQLFKEYVFKKTGINLKTGDDLKILFSPQKFQSYENTINTVKKTRNQLFIETDFNDTKEDETFQVILDPILDESGEVEYIMISGYNVSDLRNAKKRLYEERERLSVTLKSIGEGVIVTDNENRIIYFNPTASEITGYQDTEAVSKPLDEIFVIKEADLNDLAFIFNSQNSKEITLLSKSDGTLVYIEYTQTEITDNDNTKRGQIIVFKDITERLRLEHEVLKNSKLDSLGVLAGGLAHDYNNLLTAILGNITLSKIFSTEAEVLETLRQAEIAANKASELTQKLITFSKGGSPIKTPIQINDFLEEIVLLYLTGSNIKPVFDMKPDMTKLAGDRDQLSQAISNIIINAKQSMPDGGELFIKTSIADCTTDKTLQHEPGDYVKIEICDNGMGIDKNILTKIFDPYFTTKPNATGLGLSTAYSIIKKHSGHIHATNIQDGTGAVFIIYLPLMKPDGQISEQKPATEKTLSGKLHLNILVMDDDPLIRTTLSSMLKQLSCTVSLAADGMEAIEIYKKVLAENEDFDVIMLDLTIPGGMGGKIAITKLKELNPDATCIVTSGYYDDPVMSSWKEYGFSGCLKKPYTIEMLYTFLAAFAK